MPHCPELLSVESCLRNSENLRSARDVTCQNLEFAVFSLKASSSALTNHFSISSLSINRRKKTTHPKMSDAGSETASNPPAAEVEVAEVAADKSGPMSVEDALQEVIKTALVHDGLARGLRECAKALDKREAHLCVLVETVTEGQPNASTSL